MVSPFMTDAEKLSAVRAALPSLAAGIQLNTGSVGPLPVEVAAAMDELQQYGRNVGRSSYDDYLALLDRMAEARAAVAAIVGADLDEVALTHATTDGMNVATWGLDWRPGDRAVTTIHEHPGLLGPLYALRDRVGIEVEFADVGAGGDEDGVIEAFDRAMGPGTRLVACSHVLWSTGAVLPVARIAALAHERGAVVAIDGAQAAGAIPVSVRDVGADAYAVAGQKWLLGPEGTGAVWVAREAWDVIRPSFAGYFAFSASDSRGLATWQPDARRYETAGYNGPAVVGLARAISWLSMYVGLDFVHRRGAAAARRAAEALATVPGVTVLTPMTRMATLVTFRIAGWEPQAALEELGARTFAIARTIPLLDALRISVGFFTADEEIDRFVDGVRLLAEHRPETLPPRRTLPIFGEA